MAPTEYDHLATKAFKFIEFEQYDKAFELTKSMIRLERHDELAYTIGRRAATKMGDDDRAKRFDNMWVRLKDEPCDCHTPVHERRPRDPMTVFPRELIRMIFQLLAIPQIVQSMRVSKGWGEVLTSSDFAPLFYNLEVGPKVRTHARAKYITSCVKLARGGVKSATLFLADNPEQHHAFEKVLALCKNLRSLTLVGGKVSDLWIKNSYSPIGSLTKLALSDKIQISVEMLELIFERGTNLAELDVRGVTHLGPELKSLGRWTNDSNKLQHLRLHVVKGKIFMWLGRGLKRLAVS